MSRAPSELAAGEWEGGVELAGVKCRRESKTVVLVLTGNDEKRLV